MIIIYFLAQSLLPNMLSGNNKPIVDYTTIDWIKAFWNYNDEMPICYQFWFIRDLMVVILMSPIIYVAIKKFNVYFVGLIGLVWLLNFNVGVTGISITAIFFFSVGSLFSISKYDFLGFLERIKIVGYIMSVLLIIIEMYLYNSRGSVESIFSDTLSIVLYKTCTICLMVSCLNITVYALRRAMWKTNEFIYDSNFFIYAYHTMPLVLFLKLLLRFVHPDSDIRVILIYITVPFITIIVGLMIFALMRKIFPRFTMFITGGRK